MDTVVRVSVILVGIVLIFVLLFLNKYVVKKYWLPAVADVDEDEAGGEGDRRVEE